MLWNIAWPLHIITKFTRSRGICNDRDIRLKWDGGRVEAQLEVLTFGVSGMFYGGDGVCGCSGVCSLRQYRGSLQGLQNSCTRTIVRMSEDTRFRSVSPIRWGLQIFLMRYVARWWSTSITLHNSSTLNSQESNRCTAHAAHACTYVLYS